VFRKVVLAALLAGSLIGLTACGSTTNSVSSTTANGKHHYTFELINGDNIDPYFLTVWHGASVEAKKLGVSLVEEAPATFDYEQQAPLVTDAIAKHVSAIILSADATGNTYNPQLAAAKAAGIPVIVINETEADMNNNPNALSFITSSNEKLAEVAAKETGKLLNGHGVVGVLNSSITIVSDLHRVTCFEKYMKKHYPGITVLPQQISGDSISKASSLATDLIMSHPDISAIYAVDSFNGQGVGTAVSAAGKAGKIKVIAIDAEPQEVSLMKQGVIQALVAQQPYNVGKTAVQYAFDALTGKSNLIVRSVEPPGIVVTPENLNTPAMQKVVYQTWHP